MKFPLSRQGLFPPLVLSDEDEERLEALANALVRETLGDYDAFVADGRGRVDPVRWKPLKRRDDVTVYRERSSQLSRSLSTPDRVSGLSSLAQTIRLPASSTRSTPDALAEYPASPDGLGFARHSADGSSGFLARTIGPPSSAYSNSVSDSFSRPQTGEAELPRLLAVGSMRGSLDDVMYGVVSPSAAAARLRTSYLDDDVADCAVLKELIAPSESEPFRFLGVKWLVKASKRSRALQVWPRDFIVLEHSGVMLRPDGTRLGFHLMHSVDLPGCRELADHRILRARLSSCYIYEDKPQRGRVDVYMAARVEPRGAVIERLALRSAARALSRCWQSVACANSKKLAWWLQHEREPLALPAPPLPHHEDAHHGTAVLDAAPRGRSCGVCHRHFGALNRVATCQLCGEAICYRCRVVRKLSAELLAATVAQTSVVFCKTCVSSVAEDSALEIASRELVGGPGAIGRERSSSGTSSLRSGRSRTDSFSSERDTYSSVVLGRPRRASDADSRASSQRSVLSDRDALPPTFARQSSAGARLGGYGSGSGSTFGLGSGRGFSLAAKRTSARATGSTDALSIADLDGFDDAASTRTGGATDEPALLDDSFTKLENVDLVEMPLATAAAQPEDDDDVDVIDCTPPPVAAVQLFSDDDEDRRSPLKRSTGSDQPAEVDYEFRMSEMPAPRVEVVDDDQQQEQEQEQEQEADDSVVEATVVEVDDDVVLAEAPTKPRIVLMSPELESGLNAAGSPSRKTSVAVDTEDASAARLRAHTTAVGGAPATYQTKLWMQMNDLRDQVENTYQVAKANTELAKATVAAERPRNIRTYSQFNFNVVGLRPTRAMTTAAAARNKP